MNPFVKRVLDSSIDAIIGWIVVGIAGVAVGALVLILGHHPTLRDTSIGFIVGVAFILISAHSTHWIRAYLQKRKAKGTALELAEKGFMDFKLQANSSIKQISIIMEDTNAILEQMNKSLGKQSARMKGALDLAPHKQHGTVAAAAKDLSRFSRKLDKQNILLERSGNSFIEGITGWLKWMSKIPGKTPIEEMRVSLSQMVNRAGIASSSFGSMLAEINSLRGVSRELNVAIDGYDLSLTRIKEMLGKISAAGASLLKETDKSGGN